MDKRAEPLSAVWYNELTGPLLTSVSVADIDSRTSHVAAASSFKEKTTRTIRHFVLNSEKADDTNLLSALRIETCGPAVGPSVVLYG